jgi:photosystem II stability/assembly factor-like uncharacterized protein
MKSKSIAFGIFFLSIFLFTQTESFSQSVWSTNFINNIGGNYLRKVKFLNSNIGYSGGGNGTFVKTTNGGDNWAILNTGSSGFISSLFFINQYTGWVGSTIPEMKKTTDGGATWSGVSIPTTDYVADIWFVNSMIGYASAHSGQILKTTNGGSNWINIAPSSQAWGEVQFIDEDNGWVLSDYDLYKTCDGGNSWSSILHNTSNHLGYFQDYYFLNQSTGWVTVPNGIAKTTNGGDNWAILNIPLPIPMSVVFLNQNLGWCTGYDNTKGIICRTIDGGMNWVVQKTENGNKFYDLSFINQNQGWACGNAIISSTVNGSGGMTSVLQTSSLLTEKYSLKQNYPNPFNPTTNISFDVTNSTFVSLKVFDMTGREVKTLVNENVSAGNYEINFNASELNSGVYFYTLKTNEFTETKKMMLVK